MRLADYKGELVEVLEDGRVFSMDGKQLGVPLEDLRFTNSERREA